MDKVNMLFADAGQRRIYQGEECISTERGTAGVVMYGPYEDRAPGRYRIDFRLALADDKPALGNAICAVVEVLTGSGASWFAQDHILYSQLGSDLRSFSVEVFLAEPRQLEYRIQSTGQISLIASSIVYVSPLLANAQRYAHTPQERIWQNESELLDGYLRNITGIIHVGANLGQERRYYWMFGVDVLWVEPISEIYARLVDNISRFPRQRAINALLTDREGDEITFRIASNNGASSSILPFDEHAVLYPDITYVEERQIRTTTLKRLIEDHRVPLDRYQALTLDTEGAELMVLTGAGDMLSHFQYVKCEVADFPARVGTPTALELDAFMRKAGFSELARRQADAGLGNQGTYWDIVWKRVVPGEPLHAPGVKLPLVMSAGEVDGVEKCE